MSGSDIIFILSRPFPVYRLSYSDFVIGSADSEDHERDFLNVIDDAFNPPNRVQPKYTTHQDFELDLAEGWYTRDECLVLYDGATPVAAGQIRVEKNDEGLIGYIDTLGVPKGMRGRGYGIEMTKRRILALIDRGAVEIRTEVEPGNDTMQSILRELGFVPVSPLPTDQ